MVTSIGIAPVLSETRTRRPFATGSMVGVVGTFSRKPLKLSRSSVAGSRSLVRISLVLLGSVGTVLVHGSQASPNASPSAFAWPGLAMASQLSRASQTVSLSVSGRPVSAGQTGLAPVQVSSMSQREVEGRQMVVDGLKVLVGQ